MSKPWSGRFRKQTLPSVDEFNASIGFDVRLWEYDIRGSIAHAHRLAECGVITENEANTIIEGLEAVAERIRTGTADLDLTAEDIHMNIEKLLHDHIGELAGKLHTGRSRNDQIALDMRMYLKDQIRSIECMLLDLQETLVMLAESHTSSLMPGYTHLQHAQPVPFAHHLLAYFWMFERDRERLANCFERTDVLPLGAGALAGTSFPINREATASELGFSRISENSIDAVSDRDFVVEFISVASIIAMHISRLAEEIVLWSSSEFGFLELDDSVATGSSIMPQKKNPDVAELIRGKTGRVYGSLFAILTVLKGLPLSYNKDLQEDKEPLFDVVDTLQVCLPMLKLVMQTARFQPHRMAEALEGDFSTAVDIADNLVRNGVPFRSAHHIVGRLVRYCLDNGKSVAELSDAELKSISSKLRSSMIDLSVESAVESRDVPGGTSSRRVREQIQMARRVLKRKLIPPTASSAPASKPRVPRRRVVSP